jgi:hypothetical protein
MAELEQYISNSQYSKETQFGRYIGIHNRARSGKTLTAIWAICYYLQRLNYIKGVISNVILNLKPIGLQDKYVPFKNIKMLKKYEYKNYIVFIDEFRRFCDARMSTSFKNIFISNIIADAGKFKQICILTDQDASAVDKRIRGNVNAVLRPEVNFKTGYCNVIIAPSYNSYFLNDGYDSWGKGILPSFKFPFREYYDLFDTEQKIDEYLLTFEPKDYADEFIEWMQKKGYDKIENVVINKPMLTLWKEENGVSITQMQLSALLQYMYLERRDLNIVRPRR